MKFLVQLCLFIHAINGPFSGLYCTVTPSGIRRPSSLISRYCSLVHLVNPHLLETKIWMAERISCNTTVWGYYYYSCQCFQLCTHNMKLLSGSIRATHKHTHLLSPWELELCSPKGLNGRCLVVVLSPDWEDNLTNIHSSNSSLWLPKRSTHTSLQPTPIRKHIISITEHVVYYHTTWYTTPYLLQLLLHSNTHSQCAINNRTIHYYGAKSDWWYYFN